MNKLLFALVLSLGCFYTCTQYLTGTETETQTGQKGIIYGKVLQKSTGIAESNKPVLLHSQNDSLPKQISTYTDSQGFFSIDSVESGAYFLEIGDSIMSALVPCSVITGKDWSDTIFTHPTGFVTGNFYFLPGFLPILGKIFYVNVFINEINRNYRIKSPGIFTFAYLPAFSNYTFSYTFHLAKAIKTTFQFHRHRTYVNAGDTTNIGNIALSHGNTHIYGSFPRDTFNVHHAKLTITAHNLLPILSDLTITDTTLSGVIEGIPEGPDRIFEANVFDSNNAILFSGKDTIDIEEDSLDTLYIKLGYHLRGI